MDGRPRAPSDERVAQKKTLYAKEQQRPDVKHASHVWKAKRLPIMGKALERLVFIDETSTNTKLTKQTGWAPKGERLYGDVPFGHWKTQTFIAGLRIDGITAPWCLDRPMNGEAFKTYLKTRLVPALRAGDIVVCDILAAHKVAGVQEIIETAGATIFYLPPYSPDLNPIGQTFAKIKHRMRMAEKRTVEETWRYVGKLINTFTPNECKNYLKNSGYGSINR